ncbi:hypothetical protein CBM2587_A50033 [Cupriavidus taiwanensis]|uniref:Uncharacterized protein n=1 Tax=Cupriavidus taiwanensis TaxID=164546 RepID=A0A975X2Z2_9BURK|nr:hypothetical protein CBM2587_A50033 [Cupriavidus taiwanensis]
MGSLRARQARAIRRVRATVCIPRLPQPCGARRQHHRDTFPKPRSIGLRQRKPGREGCMNPSVPMLRFPRDTSCGRPRASPELQR